MKIRPTKGTNVGSTVDNSAAVSYNKVEPRRKKGDIFLPRLRLAYLACQIRALPTHRVCWHSLQCVKCFVAHRWHAARRRLWPIVPEKCWTQTETILRRSDASATPTQSKLATTIPACKITQKDLRSFWSLPGRRLSSRPRAAAKTAKTRIKHQTAAGQPSTYMSRRIQQKTAPFVAWFVTDHNGHVWNH